MNELDLYDYDLPEELIAKQPLPERDASRLLVLDRQTGAIAHRTIRDLPLLLRPKDCLVLNDTRVLPARLVGRRTQTGGKWEGLYLGRTGSGLWRLIGQTRGKLRAGEQLTLVPAHRPESHDELVLTLVETQAGGVWTATLEEDGDPLELLHRFGTVPLPPYIRRPLATDLDWERYQTTYARHPGSVAAPTAGLHFTAGLLEDCRHRGIEKVEVTLHVGIGTFRPIAVENLRDHRMHSEWCELTAETADHHNTVRHGGGRIVAVGTTTVRTLESAAKGDKVAPWFGETDLFIRPEYDFRAVDCLLTNFHLPRSSLFVLVCALAGVDPVKTAYDAAIRERYRFFSYGDAMLIV